MKELHKHELNSISGGCESLIQLMRVVAKVPINQVNAPIGHNLGFKPTYNEIPSVRY
ncbi:bacteriocin [Candidatus Williamhamiltonella defendens]|uniref:bacteriocin n=1 Tax=Candidatus Williamhamiltonella defendens TaxID=138072 RepID=UPI000F505FE9